MDLHSLQVFLTVATEKSFSRAAGKNLGPFFEAWGVPTSAGARDSVKDLTAWMPADWPEF